MLTQRQMQCFTLGAFQKRRLHLILAMIAKMIAEYEPNLECSVCN
jgi:hypothetical protein